MRYHFLKFVPWVLKNILYVLHNYITKTLCIYYIAYIDTIYTNTRIRRGSNSEPVLEPERHLHCLEGWEERGGVVIVRGGRGRGFVWWCIARDWIVEKLRPSSRQHLRFWSADGIVSVAEKRPISVRRWLTQRLCVIITVPLPHTPRPHDWFILEPLPCVPFNADW